jgi:glycosidase
MQWDASANNGFTTGTPWTPLSSSNDVHVAAQDGIPGTMLETYRGLIAVRKLHEALRTGSYTEISTADSRVYAFLRETGGETILVLANLDDASSLSADADLASVGITSATVTDIIWSNPMAPVTPNNADAYGPMLDPRVFLWLQLE